MDAERRDPGPGCGSIGRVPLALALVLLLTLAAPAGARPRWQWPVPGRTVLRHFAVGPDRFAAGQHRGVTLAAPPGTAVRAACGGGVTFSGTAGSSGATVAVACGPLSATYTHLGAVRVRRGAWVVAGERVGAVGPGGRVQLGARVRARPDGYLDPLRLLGAAPPLPPVGPAPPRLRARRRPPPSPAVPRPAPAPARPATLWPAVGLGLLGAVSVFGAAGAVLRRGRRRDGLPRRGRGLATRSVAGGGPDRTA